MAPEQFAGQPCAASDTYALSVIAYELVTGNKPFASSSMLHLVAEDKMRPAPLRAMQPELSPAAERSILKAMSFRPERHHRRRRPWAVPCSSWILGLRR
jgi:serine/threonine protein kinase